MGIHGQGAYNASDPSPPRSAQEAADRLARGWDEATSEPGPRYAGTPEDVEAGRGIKFDEVLYCSDDVWLIGGTKDGVPKTVYEFGRFRDQWMVDGVWLTCNRGAL